MDEEQLREKEQEQDTSVAPKVKTRPLSEDDQALLEDFEYTFNGTFVHGLDSKGRVIVPASFRALLGDSFCIAPSRDFSSVGLYPPIVLARMRADFAKKDQNNQRLIRYLKFFDGLIYRDQACDNQGRVLLPLRLREMILKGEKDLEVKGSHDYVRIAIRKAEEDEFAQLMEMMNETLADISQSN